MKSDTGETVNPHKVMIAELQQSLQEIQQRLASIETNLQLVHPRNGHYTILGFAQVANRTIHHDLAVRMGKRAVVLSEARRLAIGKLPDAKYGCVNLYHREVLDTVFRETFAEA
jgi:hypothetical protein